MALFLFAFLTLNQIFSQQFTGIKREFSSEILNGMFTHYEVYEVPVQNLNAHVQSSVQNSVSDLTLGQHHWKLQLNPSGVYRPGQYSIQIKSDQGLSISHPTEQIAFKGYDQIGQGKARITLTDDVLYGYVKEGNKTYYVEPLWYHESGVDKNLVILYEHEQVINDGSKTCGAEEASEALQHYLNDDKTHAALEAENSMACYELELAIASDFSMVQQYGSAAGVIAHNVGVINDVMGDYTGNFNHDIEFVIVTQWISTGADPWSNTTNSGTLLNEFTSWGNAGNFGVPFDLGELWTNRTFLNGVVGIAWLSGLCTSNKYHCLSDFTSNADLLRCMSSHEIGHNLSAVHDSGSSCPYIMCPFVSASTTWSSQSQSSINSFVQQKINSGCLTLCGPPPVPLVADFTWNPDPACVNQNVAFTNLSTGSITGYSWVFQSGTPTNSTQQNPTSKWINGGTFNVTLTLSGVGGPVSLTKQIMVIPNPVANFTSSMSGTTATFNNTSTNATSYSWDFGDGGFSLDQNPVYTYPVAGTYTVVLTAVNDCGTSTKTIIVNTAPSADFSASPTSGCAPLVVQFTNESSTNATQFSWQFLGGSPSASSQTNPIVVYQSSGTYSVTLVATNASGANTVIKTSYITVQNLPGANFSFTTNGLNASFTNNSANATSFAWNFGDGGTSTATNPTHSYANGGTYTVTLTSTNACGSVTTTQTVNLGTPPTAAFTATPTSGCGPLTVQFSNASSTNTTTLAWQFPGGTPGTSNATNPTVVYSLPGTYTVILTASNASGFNTSTQTNYITVNTTPSASFTGTTSGSTATFSNASSNANSYSWNFGDGGSSTDPNPTHNYAADGTYTVVLTATNDCGSTTATQTVTVVTPPTANFTASNTSGCAPLTVQYTSTSSANSATYSWQFPGATPSTSSAQNPSVVYSTPGVYSATLTVSNAAGNNTATQTNYITVNTTPSAAFSGTTSGATATFSNTSSNAASYSWNFGDGGSSTDANPTHTYAADGTYTVVLTATNPCGSTTATQTVTVVTPPTASFSASNTNGCAPLTVQFTSTSSANSGTFNWQFPGGTPSTSTAQNPSVVYSAPGTYSATLTVSNAAGSNTATQSNIITVNTTPTASFSSTVNAATATFSNGSSNAASYSWNFGDGGSSTDTNPSHTYAADGTYTVVMTASNPCGTATYTQSVVIITSPNAGFTANSTSGCPGMTVQFNNLSSSNATSWAWTFPGGNPASSTAQNPVVMYLTPGTYNVVLVASGPGGTSTYTQPNFITVFNLPGALFTSSTTGTTVSFDNTSSNATSYSWNFGDGSMSSEANPSHNYAHDGTYTVSLTAINNCGAATFEQTVTIVTGPTGGFTASTTSGCAPLNVQFTSQSSDNTTSYFWTFQGAFPNTSTEQNPSAVWAQPGSYTVTQIVSNLAGSDTTSMVIQVNSAPTGGFSTQTAGLSAIFTNSSVGATNYLWTFGDGGSSTDTNPTHTYASTGTYTVTLRATNDCGFVEISSEVTISGAAPLPAFSADNTHGCPPFTVHFTDNSIGAPTSWNWSFPGGNPASSTNQNPTVTYSTPGLYNVSLEATNAFGSNTNTNLNYITVDGIPVSAFSFNATGALVKFTNQSQNGTNYQWNFGDGSPLSAETDPSHTYSTSGSYTVELTVSNSCGAATLQQTISVIVTGVGEASWLQDFRVYPNPNNGVFRVEMQGTPQREVDFLLYNAIGELIARETSDFGTGTLSKSFQYSNLPSGLYHLQLRAGDKVFDVKLAVSR